MFSVVDQKRINSLDLEFYKYLHKETGLEVIHLKNDDEQKVFHATFRTPPIDNSGVFHILEHSVLCGSQKFRAKDLFNELMKGSINTYLNAMTFSDKTMYPFASMYNKDFFNLMTVYLDTVFNPLIYENDYFFSQEGWNYRIRSKRKPIEMGGIVYNEMKGAYTSPERTLIKSIDEVLFKDSLYEYDAGGVPYSIPSLSYEQFLLTYETYYDPSNCLIFLYGAVDIDRVFHIIENSITHRNKRVKPNFSFEPRAKISDEIKYAHYSVSKENPEGAYFALSYLTSPHLDFRTSLSLEMLTYMLSGTDASPLKQAMNSSKISKEFQTAFRTSCYYTSLAFIGKNSRADRFSEFSELIISSLKETAKNGINPKLIEGALNKWEFYFLSEDFGSRPKGLFLGILAASAWVYGGNIFDALSFRDMFEDIKKENSDYFSDLIKKYILDNDKAARVILVPKLNLIKQEEDILKEQLDSYKNNLTKDELNELVLKTKALDKFIRKPVSKSVKKKIPILLTKDIKRDTKSLDYSADASNLFMRHEKKGITYLNASFKCDSVAADDLPYLGFLKEILGKTDNELINDINIFAGSVNYTLEALQFETGSFIPKLSIKIKSLTKNIETVLSLIIKAITPIFTVEKVEQVKKELLVKLQSNFLQNGHSTAISRALSGIFPAAYFSELTGGISFFEEIFRKSSEEIIEKLNLVKEQVFTRENLFVAQSFDSKYKDFDSFKNSLNNHCCASAPALGINPFHNEGFSIDSGISYNAKAYNLYKGCDNYSGRLQVAKSILNLDYLWHEIRNKNSAYGCGASFNRNGNLFFYSYRDPEITKTYEIFDRSFEFLSNYKAAASEFDKLIINAIKPFEKPLKPDEALDVATHNFILGTTEEKRKIEREDILGSKIEHINQIGETLQNNLKNGVICTLGNSTKIDSCNLFLSSKNLLLT